MFAAVEHRLLSSKSMLENILSNAAVSDEVHQLLSAVMSELDGTMVDLRAVASKAPAAGTRHGANNRVAGFARPLLRADET